MDDSEVKPVLVLDQNISQAVGEIIARSNYHDEEYTAKSFFDDNIVEALHTRCHEVFSGRTGVGKTHILRMLEHVINTQNLSVHEAAIYINLQELMTWHNLPHTEEAAQRIALHAFLQVLRVVIPSIRKATHLRGSATATSSHPVDNIQEMGQKTPVPIKIVDKRATGNKLDASVVGGFEKIIPTVKGTITGEQADNTERVVEYQLVDKIDPSKFVQEVNKELSRYDLYVYLLIDEWAFIPVAAQPYFAEYIKRYFVTSQRIKIKIATIMERSKFRIGSTSSGFVGLSLGNELNYRIDIDRKYVFDTDPIKTRDYCMEILYHQVMATLDTLPCGAVYLEDAYDIHSVADFCNHLFEDEVAVCSIVKVSGGNARDLINIFANSFRRANSSGHKICVEDVLYEADEWFKLDKLLDLSSSLQGLLDTIVKYIVDKRNTRGFFIRPEDYNNSLLPELVDGRVLHFIKKNERVPVLNNYRYHIIAIDYGAFICAENGCFSKYLFDSDQYEDLCAGATNCPQRIQYPPTCYHQFDLTRKIFAVQLSFLNESIDVTLAPIETTN